MFCFHILVILFFINGINVVFTMEEDVSDRQLTKKSPKKSLLSDFFNASPTIGSGIFIHPHLNEKNLLIKSSEQTYSYALFVLTIEPVGFEKKMDQFGLLKELHSNYLKLSTLKNEEGECLDPIKANYLKKEVQAKGFQAFLERAVCCKIVAERKFSKYLEKCKTEIKHRLTERKEADGIKETERKKQKETRATQRQKKLKRVEIYALQAEKDFREAYNIDNNCEIALNFAKEMKTFNEDINKKIIDSDDYRHSLDFVKKAELVRRDAQMHIRSARDMKTSCETIPEEKEIRPQSARTHSMKTRRRTFESLRRKLVKPKEKRRSFEDSEPSEKQEVINDQHAIKIIAEYKAAEELYVQVIELYFSAFEIFRAEFLLNQIKKMLINIDKLEFERHTLSDDSFVRNSQKIALKERLHACWKLLKKETEETDSSTSE